MKKVVSLVLASILGGGLALGGYFLITKNTQQDRVVQNDAQQPKVFQTNYVPTTTTMLDGTAIDFTKAAEETVHAVVHVKNKAVPRTSSLEELFFGRGNSNRSVEPAIVGAGSGVIISPDGYIITNNHVIKGADNLEIVLNNQKTYTAEVIGTHERSDIALLKIKAASDLPYVPFGNSDVIKVGEWVLAVGNPFNLTSTVTAGIVSAKARNINGLRRGMIESFIQTDAAVNPGNSGGALVNIRGELVGINTAITSQTGSFVGYSFAVPSNIAKKVIEDLMEFGDVRTAYLGILPSDLNSQFAKELDLDVTQGVLIAEVTEDGGAKAAGLKANDIVVQLDEIKISRFSDMQGFLSAKRPGDVVHVTALRNGTKKQFKVKLANQFGKEKLDKYDFTNYHFGTLKKLSKAKALKFKINYGVEISNLKNRRLKEGNFEIKNGDILLKIGRAKVYTTDDVESILRKNKGKEIILQVLKQSDESVEYIRMTI